MIFTEMSLAPMEEAIAGSLNQRRLALRLAGGFGAVALVLSALGIYGVLAGAWAAGHAVRSFLFGVKSLDPATLAAVAGLLLVISVAAALVPALRAAMVNPIEALRFE